VTLESKRLEQVPVVWDQVASDHGRVIILSRPDRSKEDEPGCEEIGGRDSGTKTAHSQHLGCDQAISESGTSAKTVCFSMFCKPLKIIPEPWQV